MKAEKWGEEEEEKGGEGLQWEGSSSSTRDTVSDSACLFGTAMPRQAQLAQLHLLRIFCCCQGNKLSRLWKKSSHSKDVFSNAGLNLKLACILNIQPV